MGVRNEDKMTMSLGALASIEAIPLGGNIVAGI
jgi:hypothetical protein